MPLSEKLRLGGQRFTDDANTRSDYTKESPDDSYAKRLGKNALHTSESLLPLLMGKGLGLEADAVQGAEGLYKDAFETPMSQLDAERAASMGSRNELADQIKAKISPEQSQGVPSSQPPMNMEEAMMKMSGNKGMPQMAINPATGAPYTMGEGMGSKGDVPLNIVPKVMEGSVSDSEPQGNDAIMQLLTQQLMPTEKIKPTEEQSGVNMPLLMAGLAMMASKGNGGDALAEGLAAFTGAQANAKKAADDEEAKLDLKKQKNVKNLLDYLKIQAYMQQVNQKKSGAITPYQQAMLALKEKGLGIQQQNANTKKKAADQFGNLFGESQGLTQPDGAGNLEEILAAFAEAEAARDSTPQPIDPSLLGE